MKKNIISVLFIAVFVAIVLAFSTQTVSAGVALPPPPPLPPGPPVPSSRTPGEGSWTWTNEDVTGTIVSQQSLAGAFDDPYADLHTAGIHISGPTQICHPYPGGQFGWSAQIRVLTPTGWQAVPTVNEWVPDKEGKFMTCAQANFSGTYAVFGSWVKPSGFQQCPVPGFGVYITTVDYIVELIDYFGPAPYTITGCTSDGGFTFSPPITDPDMLVGLELMRSVFYCCNDTVYAADALIVQPPPPPGIETGPVN